ncbi:hypothetical protein WJX77_011505 [Trebouxia sp. C0004]
MSCSLQDRAHLRERLQDRLNGKVSGFRSAHLDAMIKLGLTSQNRLARTSWSELSQKAGLPRMLVQALLEAYNSNALNGPDSPEKQPLAVKPAAYGKRGSSNCFHTADLIIAANQTADALQQAAHVEVSVATGACQGNDGVQEYIGWGGLSILVALQQRTAQHVCTVEQLYVSRGPEAIFNNPRQWYDIDGLPNGWVSSEKQLKSVLSKFKESHHAPSIRKATLHRQAMQAQCSSATIQKQW